MIYTRDDLRPVPMYPTYPPYHVGDYLEDYFYKRFVSENPSTIRDYIGISWTTLYCHNDKSRIQFFLDQLPKNKQYFTVSQHDDAPAEKLPENTICFSAGGNIRNKNIFPIPLICSKLDLKTEIPKKKLFLASFVGSATHPIRSMLFQSCKKDSNIFVQIKGWTPNVNKQDFDIFLEATINSTFCLCPRGYGLNSFRLYESMQLGSIPVIVTDIPYLPWEDELNWNEFSVLIKPDQIQNISEILRSYSEEKIQEMQKKVIEVYETYFTLNGLYNNVIKRIQK